MNRLAVVFMVAVRAPGGGGPAAEARSHGHGGHHGSRHHFQRAGFARGFGGGPVVGCLLWTPPYSCPPPPGDSGSPGTCYTTERYWTTEPLTSDGAFTTYHRVWVSPQTVCP